MTRNLMMSIVLSFVASFVTACVGAPEADVSAAAEGSALSSQAAIGGDQEDLSCPGAGTCAKADQLCTTPGSQWCNILSTCWSCYPDGWLTGNGPVDDHVAAPKAAVKATGSEEDLTCPGAGTCAKADQACTTPGSQACNILATCWSCYPDGWLTGNGPADDHVAAPKAEATRSQESLSCPAAGTCNKADQLCTTPGSQWCNILDQCFNCGWPY